MVDKITFFDIIMNRIFYLPLFLLLILFSCKGSEDSHSTPSDISIIVNSDSIQNRNSATFYSELNQNDERYLALLYSLRQPVGENRTDSLNDVTILTISRYSDGSLSEGLGVYIKDYIKNRPNFISHIYQLEGFDNIISLLIYEIGNDNGLDVYSSISQEEFVKMKNKYLTEIIPYTSEKEREIIGENFDKEYQRIINLN